MAQTPRYRRPPTSPRSAGKKSPRRKPTKGFKKGFGNCLTTAGRWLNQPVGGVHAQSQAKSGWQKQFTKPRSILPAYIRLSWAELRAVTWPTFPQAMRLTWAVFVFATFFTILVAALDWALTKAFAEIILNELNGVKDFLNNLF